MSEIREENPHAFDLRYIERIEDAVVRVVDDMDLNALTQYSVQQMSDYYVNVASVEEIEELLAKEKYGA